jgi:hypothetical protein
VATKWLSTKDYTSGNDTEVDTVEHSMIPRLSAFPFRYPLDCPNRKVFSILHIPQIFATHRGLLFNLDVEKFVFGFVFLVLLFCSLGRSGTNSQSRTRYRLCEPYLDRASKNRGDGISQKC